MKIYSICCIHCGNDEFDELVIETTGIADPATIAQPFLVYPDIQNYYTLERVICIVDAQKINFQLEETEEARKQIVSADIILINKVDTIRKEHFSSSQHQFAQFHIRQAVQPRYVRTSPAGLSHSSVKEHIPGKRFYMGKWRAAEGNYTVGCRCIGHFYGREVAL